MPGAGRRRGGPKALAGAYADGMKRASDAESTLAPDRNGMKPTVAIVVAAFVIASPASAQTMYRCYDLGKTIYSDKPCLNGDEVKQIMPNGNPSEEQVARSRAKARAGESGLLEATSTGSTASRPPFAAATMARMLLPLWDARKPSFSRGSAK